MAPLKALCNEKYNDWNEKFASHNLNCIELTGDSENIDDLNVIKKAHIVCTTPVSVIC